MSYTSQAAIEAEIPASHLIEALDDDRDGQIDTLVLSQILANADAEVNACLEGLYATPFADEIPACCAAAALALACEAIYSRRQVERNPYSDRAAQWRGRLARIGAGDLPLSAAVEADANARSSPSFKERVLRHTREDQDGL